MNRNKIGIYVYHVLLVAFLLFFKVNLSAQSSRMKFDKISLENGLSQSSVTNIIQDRKGFMWFGTLDGLNKYDGYKVTVYRHNIKDTLSIAENAINTIYENHEGNLWIGTKTKGICKYNVYTNKFYNFANIPGNGNSLSNNDVKCIFEDKEGIFWIGTARGLNKFDIKKNKFRHFFHFDGDDNSIANNTINCLFYDKSGFLWIGTDDGLSKYNFSNAKFSNYLNNPENDNSLSNNVINCLCMDTSDVLWIGTEQGLGRFDKQTETFTNYFNDPEDENSLTSNTITSLVVDTAGNVWIGTKKGGLNKLDKNGEFSCYIHDPSDQNSLSVDDALSLYLDRSNNLWVGTSLGGINKWNRTNEEIKLFRHNPFEINSMSSNQVRCFFQDKNGIVWIGTVDGGLNKWNRENNTFTYFQSNDKEAGTISHDYVRAICEDRYDNLWVGTDGGGLNLMDRKNGTFKQFRAAQFDRNSMNSNRIWKIIEDQKGFIWIATYGGGLNKFNPRAKTITIYRNDPENPRSLSNDYLTTLYEDHLGNLWIGTYGGGLDKMDMANETFFNYQNTKDTSSIGNNYIYCIMEDSDNNLWIGAKGSLNKFDRKTEKFLRYTESDGFPNDVIMGILEDDNNFFWISTNKGIVKFNRKTNEIRTYDVTDGLQSNEFLVGSYYKLQSGEMLFGGINGFNCFNPENLKINQHPPEIVITGFQIFNQPVSLDTAISEKKLLNLSYKDYTFSFEFVALDYKFPEKNQYAYMMEGFDDSWNYTGTRRFASYTNLPPATYFFRVKGSNSDQTWNEKGIAIKVVIKPAFWQTTWFKISVFISIGVIIYFIFLLRVRAIHKQKEHLEVLVKERTAEVIQQKEEIMAQRDEIEIQRDEVEKQRDIANQQRDHIAKQNKEITDSIVYAKRIQTATLPTVEEMKNYLTDSFVLFKPKDIVSGDFYWASYKNDRYIIVAADCTGHGVPGAFMSMFGVSFLNKIVNENGQVHPTDILNSLRSNIIKSLKQQDHEQLNKDGMDISLCSIDIHEKKLYFAGANNPLYRVRNKELLIVRADKMPIGIYDKMDSFETQELDIAQGDTYYLFSDGYPDQFGGTEEKKFKYNRFKQLLTDISEKPMDEQREILDQTIHNWMGFKEQIDDILVIGLRF